MSLPWNQHTMVGYSAEIGFDIITGEDYLLCGAVFMLLFLSMCEYHSAFYEIYGHSLLMYRNANANHKQNLFQTIRCHVLAKE